MSEWMNEGVNEYFSLNDGFLKVTHDLISYLSFLMGFPGSARPKILPANARDKRALRSIPESGRSPGGGHSNPLQYSCRENPMDRGAWRAAVHMVTKSRTWLKQLSTHARIPLDISLVVDAPSIFSLGETYFFPLKDPRVMKLWPALFFFFPWPSSLSPLSLSKQGSTLSCQCVLLSTKQFWFRLKFVASLFYPTCYSTFKSAASSKSVHLYRTEQSLMVSYPCYMGYTPVSGLFHFTFVKCWLLPDELIL